MRSLLGWFLFVFAGLFSLSAADVEFVRVWPAWRTAESFERISEYFTGKEDHGREVVLRTQPEQRAGFYFLARVANSGVVIPGAKFVLSLIMPSSPLPQITTFPVEVANRSRVFHLGLTGADWPGPEVHPVAWNLELVSLDGSVLSSAHSFLWAKPMAK